MADSPRIPQTDYPYAARLHAGPTLPEPATPATTLDQTALRLEKLLNWDYGDASLSPRDAFCTQGFVYLVFAFGLINLLPNLAMALMANRPPEWLAILILAPLFGIMAGEFVVFALPLVWWRGQFIWRLLAHWLVGLSLYCCWIPGFLLANSPTTHSIESVLETVWIAFMALPAISLAVQLPLWCLRIYGGWRLKRIPGDAAVTSPTQLSIGHILSGTAIVAASLTMLRATFQTPEEFGEWFWFGWALAFVAIAAASLLIVAPLAWLILQGQNPRFALLLVTAYGLLIVSFVAGAFLWINPGGEGRATSLAFSLMALTGLTTASLPLWLARASGYRLQVGKS